MHLLCLGSGGYSAVLNITVGLVLFKIASVIMRVVTTF